MSPEFRWEFGSRRPLGRLPNPLDLVRRRLAKGLDIDVHQHEVRRGGEVEAVVTSSSSGLGEVEVGLRCTELYDEQDTDSKGNTTRSTVEEVTHEAWQPVESFVGTQSVRFVIPKEAPFSYEGDCLSFKWEVVARAQRSHGLDAQVRSEISVLP